MIYEVDIPVDIDRLRLRSELQQTADQLNLDLSLIHKNIFEAIPVALSQTERVCASVNVASTRSGINMDAIMLMGRQIKTAADLTADKDGLACAKLCVFANIPQDRMCPSWPVPIWAWARPMRSSM